MDIGKEKPAIIVEPVRDPFVTPEPARDKPEPVEEPAEPARNGTGEVTTHYASQGKRARDDEPAEVIADSPLDIALTASRRKDSRP